MTSPAVEIAPTRQNAVGSAGRNTLLVLSLVSGLGGVVYEVLYLRHLTSVLGDMFYVHAGLLCMFLLGNGIGAWLAHRFLPYLFAFELAIGAYALALPGLVDVYETSVVARMFPSPVVQSLFASALLLAVPSVCIGFSIPLFSAYIRGRGGTRDAFKLAYLLYNLGAAISVVAAEFYLIRWTGFTVSLYCIGATNLTCGFVLLAKRRDWIPEREPRPSGADVIPWRSLLALFLASVAASVFLGYFIKVCYHLFLPHRQNFAVCTAISLVSIAIGTYVAKRTRWGLGAFLVLSAVAMGAVYAAFDPLVGLFHFTKELTPAWAATPRNFAFGFLLAIPYVFLGATIPALLQSENQVARRSGILLLLSGIGNVAGMLSFMFLIHPNLRVFTTLGVVWILLAVSLALHAGRRLRPLQLAAVAASALLMPLVYSHAEERVYLIHDELPEGASLTHYKATSDNVTYVETPQGAYISYNGHPSIYIASARGVVNRAEIVSGIIPALVAPRRENALVLGLGSGITAGATATMFAHTDVVEINSAFFPLLHRIERANFSIAANPSATIIHDDARSFLASTENRYDTIVNSIPSPTYFAAGKIYTLEFFDLVKTALAPGGVYCSWLAPVDMSADGLRTFLATISQRFRYCNLAILRNGYYFTACSDDPVRVSAADSVGFPAVVRKTLRIPLGVTLEQYFDSIFVSDDILAGMDLSGVPLNTDSFPIMEFQIMRQDRLLKNPEQMQDPLVFDPGRFNVRLRVGGDEESLIRQALVLAQVHPAFFRQVCVPVLAEDQALLERFAERFRELSP